MSPPPAPLELSTSDENGDVVLTVKGEIDVTTTDVLRERIRDAFDAGNRRLVVDMSAVDFIDSTGLGVLVGALKYYKEQDGDVLLRSPSPIADRVLKVSGLSAAFGQA